MPRKPWSEIKHKSDALRAEADRLEREAEEERIRTECNFHGYAWDYNGLCYSVWGDTEQCPDHHESYTDDYGMWVHCRTCSGHSGTIHVRRKLREPEWDAPQPPNEKRTVL